MGLENKTQTSTTEKSTGWLGKGQTLLNTS